EDKLLIEATRDHHRIIILNKMDLDNQLDLDELETLVEGSSIVKTSIITQAGLNELEGKIAELFFAGNTGEKDATYVSNVRHIALLNETIDAFNDVIDGIESG